MLVLYFLRTFFYYGIAFFSILTGVFASCNLFLRLPLIHDALTIPMVLWTMLPLMGLFSLPLASSLAVSFSITKHRIGDEFLLLSMLAPARRALVKAVVLFAFMCSAFYALLVFQFAPQSYRLGKQLLFKVAREHLLTLEPNKFHTPFSSFTFFFKKKNHEHNQKASFDTLFLVYSSSKRPQERFFFTAQKGFLAHDKLILSNGSMYTFQSGKIHTATFGTMDIDLQRFLENEKESQRLSGLKFFTLKRLLSSWKTEKEAYIEFHKRIAQSLWQFLFPVLAFFGASVLGFNSLLASVLLSGICFLTSYVLIALGQAYYYSLPLALALFYIPLILFFIIGLVFYRKKII
jgi:hypothetical protein